MTAENTYTLIINYLKLESIAKWHFVFIILPLYAVSTNFLHNYMIKAKYRCIEALRLSFFGTGIHFTLQELSNKIRPPTVPQQTLSHILRHTPGIVKCGNARATDYLFEKTADISKLSPNSFVFDSDSRPPQLKVLIESLTQNKEILVLKYVKSRLKKILFCRSSGSIRNAVSARISDELFIEAQAWKAISHKFNSELIPRTHLYSTKRFGRIFIMDYSETGIFTIPDACVQTTVTKVESKYDNGTKSDTDIRAEILKYFKIINGSNFIGDMSFYCGNDLRIHTIPLFFN